MARERSTNALEAFSHADVGQMNVYLNYARRHWTHEDENPPVGLILCAGKREALAEYALQGIENKMLAAEYRTQLPAPDSIERVLVKHREAIEAMRQARSLPTKPSKPKRS